MGGLEGLGRGRAGHAGEQPAWPVTSDRFRPAFLRRAVAGPPGVWRGDTDTAAFDAGAP
jgi:hypothetical protein